MNGRGFPKIEHGIFSDSASRDEEFSFPYFDPKLRLFYDTFKDEFNQICIAQAEISTWSFFAKKNSDVIFVISAVAGYAILYKLQRQVIDKVRDQIQLQAKDAKDALGAFIPDAIKQYGVNFISWVGTPEKTLNMVKALSGILFVLYAKHKITSALDASNKASNFISYFSFSGDKAEYDEAGYLISQNLCPNIVEDITFRLHDLILQLEEKEIKRLVKHLIKNLVISLSAKKFAGRSTTALYEEITKGFFCKITPENEMLWLRKHRHYYPFFSQYIVHKEMTIITDEKNKKSEKTSYENVFFKAPVTFFRKGPGVDKPTIEKYTERVGGFGETIDRLPAQNIFRRDELARMGFRSKL